MDFITRNLRTIALIAIAVALVLGILWLRSCQAERTAAAREKVATEQAGAAMQSGTDAVQTLGNQQANEIAADAVTRENDDAIHKADGATVQVAPAVRDAGLASLCRRASYRRSHSECVQQPSPR